MKFGQLKEYNFRNIFIPNTGKYGPEIIPYLDTFHAVNKLPKCPFMLLHCKKSV